MKSINVYALIAIVSLLLLSLVGCSTVEPARVVTKTEVELVTVPADLLLSCQVTEPPNREFYPKLTWKQKEDALSNYSAALIKDLNLCNIQISSIKLYQDLQQQKHKKKDVP